MTMEKEADVRLLGDATLAVGGGDEPLDCSSDVKNRSGESVGSASPPSIDIKMQNVRQHICRWGLVYKNRFPSQPISTKPSSHRDFFAKLYSSIEEENRLRSEASAAAAALSTPSKPSSSTTTSPETSPESIISQKSDSQPHPYSNPLLEVPHFHPHR